MATPCLGGVALALVVFILSFFLPHWQTQTLVLALAALLVACVGLVDDVRTLGPGARIVVELLAATMIFLAGISVPGLYGVGAWALTALWVVIVTNSFNLLDNMDGCAGLIAASTGAALIVAAMLNHQILVAGMAAIIVGSSVGFLLYNWHPARIFMGDSGSLLFGFLLATLVLKLRFPIDHVKNLGALALLVGILLFDTTLVVISRTRAGRAIYLGGADHLSHRLARLGLDVRIVALLLGAATGASAALGVLVGRRIVPLSIVLAPVAAVGIVALILLLRVSIYPEREDPMADSPEAQLELGHHVMGQLTTFGDQTAGKPTRSARGE